MEESHRPRMRISPPVFYSAAVLIFALVAFGTIAPAMANDLFTAVQSWITETFGWFYLLSVAIFLIFVVVLAFTSYGAIKLGPDHSTPDYSNPSWFAMLFSAGMGIGLVFFGVAEPIMHYADPPRGDGHTVAAARQAMSITFFHWGLHAWAIYTVVGLSLAYFSFRHNLPLTIRSALYPLIGERIHGIAGHVVDVFAVLGTMFGLATSLGFGVLQANAGFDHLFGLPQTVPVQIGLIAAITLIAVGSVVAGLDRGVKRLSELCLLLAGALLLFVLLTGPTLYLLQTLVQNTGTYLSEVVGKTFNLYAYEPTSWLGGWTLFYWGWWIAWSPFVGMFIARISRGRTIRQFIGGVLLVPVGFTFIWMTVFGNTAIYLELNTAAGAISATVSESVPLAIFKVFEYLPLSQLLSALATLLVICFFVTSSDSGSLVIDTITAGGATDTPAWQRVFWAVLEGVVAAVLLLSGGLTALQTATLVGALPFTVVMLVMCYGLWRGLRMEGLRERAYGVVPVAPAGNVPWRTRLRSLLDYPDETRVRAFLDQTVGPAIAAVADELRQHGLEVALDTTPERVQLTVPYGDAPDFLYAVEIRGYAAPSFAFPEAPDPDQAPRYFRAEVHLAAGGQNYDVMGYSRDQMINDVLSQYEKHMQFLHLSKS